MKKIKETFILSFALFAMFFGASNVILPSFIGLRVGNELNLAALGFVLSGVGLPLLGLLVVIKNKGDYLSLFEPMGEIFSKIFLLAAFLSVGPIIAIPRTAATTYEMGVLPIFPNVNGVLITFIFFVICILFCLNENNVVNEVGKILTPLLLLALIVLIIVGIFNTDTATYEIVEKSSFTFAFLEGYNTLDAIAAIIFARIIYKSVKENDNPIKVSIKASILAAIGLAVVYLGIMYLGNTVNISNAMEYERTAHIIKITEILLGKSAKIILGIIISLACLTTAIGLIATVSDFFETVLNGKLKYKYIVIIISLVSFIISQLKVDKIINLAVPILMVFYPVLIVIILLSLIKGKIIDNMVIKYTTYTALIISILDQISKKVYKIELINNIPLSNVGMIWVVPTLIVLILVILYKFINSRK